jgi:hypothetical protein
MATKQTRRDWIAMTAAAPVSVWLSGCASGDAGMHLPRNRQPLQPTAYTPLPIGSVKPTGWLHNQLRIQADGLTGHLDEFWESVNPQTSGWRGGSGESWERGPYYLDGLVPLAFLLEDERLIAKAKEWVNWTMENQQPSGYIGPDQNKGKYAADWQAKDWWPKMVMLKVLTQYYEVTNDQRVIPLMEKYLLHHLSKADEIPLVEWAAMRWAEEVLSIVYVYNRTGNEKLLELARKLSTQAYNWKKHFAEFQYPGKVNKDQIGLPTHVVNNAMALKTDAVYWQVSGDSTDRESIYQILRVMDEYHGLPNGMHSGDEHYAGRSPVQGNELCAVVEAMFSYEMLLAILGESDFADRLEKATYNALPATISADMWTHQYDQQPNQVLCTRHRRKWTSNGPDSNLFGLEPNFGCCTANFHQGWPKFVAHMWMTTPDDGLALMTYGPNVVDAPVAGGKRVRISQKTAYPFDGTVTLTVENGGGDFPLLVRIPTWADQATVKVNGQTLHTNPKPGFLLVGNAWKPGNTVELSFPMSLRITKGYNESVSVERGPLVFALDVGTEWKKIRDAGMSADYELHPTTPWNYALVLDEEGKQFGGNVDIVTRPPTDSGVAPYSPDGAPVRITIPAKLLPDWKMEEGSAADVPVSPVSPPTRTEEVALIPYGAAKLRITAFPWART